MSQSGVTAGRGRQVPHPSGLTEALCGDFVNCGCYQGRKEVAAVSPPSRMRAGTQESCHLPSPYSSLFSVEREEAEVGKQLIMEHDQFPFNRVSGRVAVFPMPPACPGSIFFGAHMY